MHPFTENVSIHNTHSIGAFCCLANDIQVHNCLAFILLLIIIPAVAMVLLVMYSPKMNLFEMLETHGMCWNIYLLSGD